MHRPARRRPAARTPSRPHLSATHLVRGATATDAADIHHLVSAQAERGTLLPRAAEEIAAALQDYVVVTDGHDRVVACAALQEYSPSLGEVTSVVVDAAAQGRGLGSMAVRCVEAMARRRGIEELFAVTLADGFFAALGYERCALARYPEKLARYEALTQRGIPILPKSCFRKRTDWPA